MRSNKAFLFSIAVIATLLGLYLIPFEETPLITPRNNLSYNPYRAGPPQNLINIQITFMDPENDVQGVIESATFDGKPVELQSPNPTRLRATIYPRVEPGTYELSWTVRKNSAVWPQTLSNNKEITITKQDQWMEILVEGNSITIQ